MPRASGRKLVVRRVVGGALVKIAAIRTKNPTIAREPIDVTSDDDDGFRTLLAEPGQKQIDLSFSGVTEDDVLLEAAAAGTPAFERLNLRFPSGATIEGDFFFNNLSITGEYNQSVTFEGEMQSSGAWTYAPAP